MGTRDHEHATDRDRTPAGEHTTDPRRTPPPKDPQAGLDREVGDLEDADAERDDGALPGRAGGGLAGG